MGKPIFVWALEMTTVDHRGWDHLENIECHSNFPSLKNGTWELLYTHWQKATLGNMPLRFLVTLMYGMNGLPQHRSDLETDSSLGSKHLQSDLKLSWHSYNWNLKCNSIFNSSSAYNFDSKAWKKKLIV